MVPFLHGALMNDGEHLARVISNNYADNLCIIPTLCTWYIDTLHNKMIYYLNFSSHISLRRKQNIEIYEVFTEPSQSRMSEKIKQKVETSITPLCTCHRKYFYSFSLLWLLHAADVEEKISLKNILKLIFRS